MAIKKTNKIVKKISIVIPTYNEEANIERLVRRIDRALSAQNIIYEIIFVDDNSTDSTREKIVALHHTYPVKGYLKEGKKGKAFSLYEGFQKAKYDVLCMIDADLQYPPEAIPHMMKKLDTADIVVANRKKYKVHFLRKFLSFGFRTVFGKLIFGFTSDIQSGLKVFKKEVWRDIQYVPSAGWAFDLEFLYKAHELGFTLTDYDITFTERNAGASKVNFLKTIWEIGSNTLKTRFKIISPHHVSTDNGKSMEGAGIRYKKKKYITHTTLPHTVSAIRTFHRGQKITGFILLFLLIAGLLYNWLNTLLVITAILSFIYFVDVIFNLYLVWKSLNYSQEITFTQEELDKIDENKLPIYSILCPLYKEAHVIPQFIDAISKIEWPKDKLDAILLLEEDDAESIETVKQMTLPSYVRTVIIPDSKPKTKPKACNYGLAKAKGKYLVIYDAEDMPDPLQLKKAYLGFKKATNDVICLQAKLNYYNPNHNFLTKLFTAEYSLWFDVSLTGLQSLNTSLPLGGTSNHFKVADLIKLQGWDPFNVTEDADLGVRLFRQGYKTAIIDSTTLEEANSRVKNWIRQRSRWIKGYMQTYLVHTRSAPVIASPAESAGEAIPYSTGLPRHSFLVPRNEKKLAWLHSIYFNLTIGGKIAFILINPFLWLATISYFALYAYVGEAIEYLYPSYIFYMAATSLVFGNFLFVYYYMIGTIKRGHWGLIKYIFFVPLYWILISIAGFIALYQLLFKPHYWEKTVHGFHLRKASTVSKSPEIEISVQPAFVPNYVNSKFEAPNPKHPPAGGWNFDMRIFSNKQYVSGSVLILSMLVANFLNFLFNAFLGRVLNYETYGTLSLINSFLYLTAIPFSALGLTVNYRSGFLEERHGKDSAFSFIRYLKKRLTFISLAISVLWLLSTPYLMKYFNTSDILPILLFAPVWLVGFIASANRGFLNAKLMFVFTALLFLFEPLLKLFSALLLINIELYRWVYISIPVSIVGTFLLSRAFVSGIKQKNAYATRIRSVKRFPYKFFFISVLSGLSAMAFLSLDVILAKHFLSAEDAGKYALISLVGKMIYFLGTLCSVFITPFVSRYEGAKKDSSHILYRTLGIASLLSITGFVVIGIFGNLTAPILFGQKTLSIIPYLLPFTFAVACFSLSTVFTTYYLTKKIYTFSVMTFLLAILQITLLEIYHQDILSFVQAMVAIGYLNILMATILHIGIAKVITIENNIKDFLGIFTNGTGDFDEEKKLRILIFNWRDTKHKWAGGAEVYIHEIAKRWVSEGNSVTVFCGNDHHSPRNQIIDGVQIVRRGGFYTVYFWAFVYYILKFRGKYDIIIDSENGIPFLTPLYVRKPIFLLIHHVHQEVFREHLSFPLSFIASFIEGKIMPYLYRNKKVITVSESSKREIVKLGFTNSEEIYVVHPGIENDIFFKTKKSKLPTLAYLGRLKPYKNIDVLIKGFAKVIDSIPSAMLLIAGEGESGSDIIGLSEKLGLTDHVLFLGKITNNEKIKLLGRSFAVVQPSQIEGWGITVIEANACQTPVIASNVNGLKDSIVDGKTGMLVQVKDVDQLAHAMITIIKNTKLRKSLSREAYLWSRQFSWDKSASEFYKVVLGNCNPCIDYKLSGELAWKKIEQI